jgi:hypothetical protein
MCNQRIAQCPSCGFSRHIFWDQCRLNIEAQTAAVQKLEPAPHPSTCEGQTPATVSIWIKPRACPTDNEACGGLRAKEAGEKEREERDRKDSGVSGVESEKNAREGIREHGGDSDWEDVAVEDCTPSVKPEAVQGHPAPKHAELRKLMGPRIKYADDYVEIGPRGMRPNSRNMGSSYALHAGGPTRPVQIVGADIVRADAPRKYLFNSETTVMIPWEIRESDEPDETYLLIMGYNDIPEVRAQWAAKKKDGPPRPVQTMRDVVETIFGESQHNRARGSQNDF